jgi:hypothetical protein
MKVLENIFYFQKTRIKFSEMTFQRESQNARRAASSALTPCGTALVLIAGKLDFKNINPHASYPTGNSIEPNMA